MSSQLPLASATTLGGATARRAALALALANAVVGLGHVPGYLRTVPDLHGAARLYLAGAVAGQVAALMLLVVAPALLVSLVRPLRALAGPLAVAGLLAAQLVLTVDRMLLAIVGVHLDRAALEVALAPGGLASLEMQRGELARLAAAGAVAIVLEVGAWVLLARRAEGRPGRAGRLLVAAVVCLLSGERVSYAASLAARWPEPARAASALPSFAVEEALRMRQRANERLRCPRVPLRTHPVADPPSMVWIVIESWRADGLDPELTPALWRFAQGATRYTDHRSGGNWTYSGVFSLFYGLHAAYVGNAQEARRGPILIDRLQELGYDIKIVASRATRFPRFRDTAFAGLPPEAIEDEMPGASSVETDRAAVKRAEAFLAGRTPGKPYFLVVFLDAPHLPYAFAPSSVRYRPYTERLYYMEMTEPQDPAPIRNRYRNALVDVDGSAGAVLAALDRTPSAASTLVVVTGDHGQEFYEHGALGHNISFDLEQTAVPLAVRFPGVAPGVHRGRTRHVDLVPTILPRLGVENPPADYSVGTPLGSEPAPRDAVVCGQRDCAVVDEDGRTTVFRPREPLRAPAVYDPAWRLLPGAAPSPAFPRVRGELSAFLQ